jgi:hypothetical protein
MSAARIAPVGRSRKSQPEVEPANHCPTAEAVAKAPMAKRLPWARLTILITP